MMPLLSKHQEDERYGFRVWIKSEVKDDEMKKELGSIRHVGLDRYYLLFQNAERKERNWILLVRSGQLLNGLHNCQRAKYG